VIGSINLQSMNPVKPAIKKDVTQESVSFCARTGPENSGDTKKTMKNVAIVATAAAVLALPILFTRINVSRFKGLSNLQASVKIFLQQKAKPIIDKLVGPKVSPDAGLNVIR